MRAACGDYRSRGSAARWSSPEVSRQRGIEETLPDEDISVWNSSVDVPSHNPTGNDYRATLLEQYKLYVEMADRISQRRSISNTFFLTLNSAFITVIVSLFPGESIGATWLLLPLAALIVQCLAWYFIVRSYRMLNSCKYNIVNELEERLPATPWKTEWRRLGHQTGPARYWRFTLLEQWIPAIFAAIYISGYCLYLFRSKGSA